VVTARQQQIAEFREALNKRHGLSEHALLVATIVCAEPGEWVDALMVWNRIATPPYPDDLRSLDLDAALEELVERGFAQSRKFQGLVRFRWIAPWQP
jgi:hypothetical protein